MDSSLEFPDKISKEDVFAEVKTYLDEKGLIVVNQDLEKPWGGYYVLSEASIQDFLNNFFSDLVLSEEEKMLRMSPKILMVAPQARLSWQYHHRRGEIWKVLAGPIAVSMNETDDQKEPITFQVNDTVNLEKGMRHRLIGKDSWGVVAEIWRHTDPSQPSNEEDIVRVQDDFGR